MSSLAEERGKPRVVGDGVEERASPAPVVRKDVVRVLRSENFAAQGAGATVEAPLKTSDPLTPPRILLVDDSRVTRTLLRRLLSRAVPRGEFVEASDGKEALTILESGDMDLVITDLLMPELDGFGVLEALRERWPDIPVIVVSGLDDTESLERALSLGAFDYLTKPFNVREVEVVLPLKVNNALGKHARSRQLRELHQQLQRELQKASAFVRQMLLPPPPEGRDGAVWYQPLLEVGGDVYDWTELDDTFWFLVADVAGHGVEAALNIALVRSLFREALRRGRTPGEVLFLMNQRLCHSHLGDGGEMYITAAVGSVQGNVGRLASAGHPAPLLLKGGDGAVCPLSSGGFVLGAFPDATFPEADPFALEAEDALLLFTDGALPRAWDAATWQRWVETVWEDREEQDPPALLKTLWHRVADLISPEERDDVTLVLLLPGMFGKEGRRASSL